MTLRIAAAVVAALWLAPVGAQAPAAGRSLEPPGGALVAPGPAPTLTLLYTGDVIGYVEDCGCKQNPAGGLSRRAWLRDQIDKNYPGTPIVLLDSGNFSDNPNEAGEIRTRGLLDGMERLGYRVVHAAERDFSLGYDAFRERVRGRSMRFVSANIVKEGTREPVLDPYAVVEVDVPGRSRPVRVGVIGVMRFNPVWRKAGPAGTNLGIAPPGEMVKRFLPELRAKADVVVLLAAMSRDDAGTLAREVPGIDFVFGAYGGMVSTKDEVEGTARVVYTGNQGQRVGETRVHLSDAGKVVSATTYMHHLTARYPASPEMEAFVADLKAKAREGGDPSDPGPGRSGSH